MRKSLLVVCLLIIFKDIYAKDGLPPFAGGFIEEAWSFLINGTIEHFFGCFSFKNFTETDITYYLYTRSNARGTKLSQKCFKELDNTKDTKILFNGWLMTANESSIMSMAKAYLTRYDCNVIIVELVNLTNTQYSEAYCNVIKGSEIIGDYLCDLQKVIILDFNTVHLIGFSIGAQICGLIGQRVQIKCNQKIYRITGLDPAGPIYQNQHQSRRLDKSDAQFVDVIHTNMGILGYYGSIGHVDYFPHCGMFQPGCIKLDLKVNIIRLVIDYVLCHHKRSVLLFVESIYGPVFNATSCDSCSPANFYKNFWKKCAPDNGKMRKYSIMGEDSQHDPPERKFLITTNRNSPYAHQQGNVNIPLWKKIVRVIRHPKSLL